MLRHTFLVKCQQAPKQAPKDRGIPVCTTSHFELAVQLARVLLAVSTVMPLQALRCPRNTHGYISNMVHQSMRYTSRWTQLQEI